MKKIVCIVISLFVLFSEKVFSQCCNANPVAGSSNIGVLTKNTFRSIVYHRYNYSDTYFEGGKKSDFNFVKYSDYNFTGAIFSYGLTNKITLDLETGYFINYSQLFNTNPPYTLKGWGFANGLFSAKYALLQKGEWELSAGAGLKFPFTLDQLTVDGVELSQSVQPSTGAFGATVLFFARKIFTDKGVQLFLIHRTEINSANIVEFKTGNIYSTSFFLSKSINDLWAAILQLRSDIRQRDVRNGEIIDVSGGYVIFLSPQINYTVTQKWNVSLMADFPFYKYFNGTQLASKYGFVISLTYDFDFSHFI